MKRIFTVITVIIAVIIMGTATTSTKISAANNILNEKEIIKYVDGEIKNIQPLKYITVLNKDQLTAIKDIDRYYGDAYWKALGRGEYADGTKVIINTEESIYIGLAWNHSIENIIVNYHNDCEHSMRWHCEF